MKGSFFLSYSSSFQLELKHFYILLLSPFYCINKVDEIVFFFCFFPIFPNPFFSHCASSTLSIQGRCLTNTSLVLPHHAKAKIYLIFIRFSPQNVPNSSYYLYIHCHTGTNQHNLYVTWILQRNQEQKHRQHRSFTWATVGETQKRLVTEL